MIGTVLEGRYRIEDLLAHGGMSTVYSGTDLRLDRTVAIKVMASGLAQNPDFVARFGREARAAARLSHVNVVGVHDQGTDAGCVFLVMELVRGRTLRDLLREHGRLSPDLAVAIAEPMLAALAAAHRAGLVHRDIKPENVLLADDGLVKVADFGLALATSEVTATVESGVVMGTVAYVAPEQVTRGRTDSRTDVYSAGIVLFEMLTGASPYAGDGVSIAYRHVHEDVPAPSTREPSLPAELDQLVVRATRRRADERPVDAAAFLAALHLVGAALGLRRVPIPPRLPHRSGSVPAGPERRRSSAQQRSDPSRRPTPAIAPATGTGTPPKLVGSRGPAVAPYAARALLADAPRPAGVAGQLLDRGARPPGGRMPAAAEQPARFDLSVPLPPPISDARRRHRRRSVLALIVVLALAAAAALCGWWLGTTTVAGGTAAARASATSSQTVATSIAPAGFAAVAGGARHSVTAPARGV